MHGYDSHDFPFEQTRTHSRHYHYLTTSNIQQKMEIKHTRAMEKWKKRISSAWQPTERLINAVIKFAATTVAVAVAAADVNNNLLVVYNSAPIKVLHCAEPR